MANNKSLSRKALIFAALLVASTLLIECLIIGFGYNMIKGLIDTSLNNEAVADAGSQITQIVDMINSISSQFIVLI